MNPSLDQERVELLRVKRDASTKKGLLPAWPRTDKELPIVELEVKWVRFSTLNHRTRAEQLREIRKTGQQNLFSQDPLGPAAQATQFRLLCDQEGFAELKEDLKDRGQQDHAVVTADGILINGNRRAAALRELFEKDGVKACKYVRCLVLPEDATAEEIVSLETELQVAKDFKQEYSWINRALLVQELCESNDLNFQRVARLMHLDVKQISSDYERIQQVNQLVEMSQGARLHIDFEPNESAFTELAQYIRNKTDEEKRAVRTVYFLGTLAGVNYRDLRNLRRADAARLVSEEIAGDTQLESLIGGGAKAAKGNAADALLDDVLGEGHKPNIVDSVLNVLSKANRDEDLKLESGASVPLVTAMDKVRDVVEKACEEASEQQKDEETVTAPVKRLTLAIKNIERAAELLERARAVPGWNEVAFKAKLSQTDAAIATLKKLDDKD